MRQARSSPAAVGLRTAAAAGAVRVTALLSRRLRLGAGSTVGGRVGLAIHPGLLAAAGAGRRVALVTGTNGKTTTTRLLAAALEAAASGRSGAVATSSAGANMPAGLVSALLSSPSARLAALEVDEGYLGDAAAALSPEVIVLLNLSRDQLDRVSEVRRTAGRWRRVLERTDAVVVANADDPLVVWAAGTASSVRHVAAGGLWRADAYHCPACEARLVFPDEGGWRCACGFRRPEASLWLDGDSLVAGPGERHPLGLSLPGRFNQANAALAAAAAGALGVPLGTAVEAMRAVEEVAGRFATVRVGNASFRLLLAKNPAGFDELLGLLAEGAGPMLLAINAREADGHDPSWLWDVPFEHLAGRRVLVSGERRLDLAVRLRHAAVDHELAEDPVGALSRLAADPGRTGGPIDVVGNYTAFQDLRRHLAGAAKTAAGRPAPVKGGASAPERKREVATKAAPGAGRRPAPRESTLRVVVVHPDLLGTYGDGGNGLVLVNRARWRGQPAELLLAPSDRPLPESADLYCLGGGEDGPQARAAEVLSRGALHRAVEKGATLLAVCAGFQLLGTGFPGADGQLREGLGLLDATTARTGEPRAVGELLVGFDGHAEDGSALLHLEPGSPLSGFENHASRTLLGPAARPLGGVLHGIGNDGRVDGAIQGRVVATYLHGPVLARNARLADALLGLALGVNLAPLADEEEQALLEERLARIPSTRRALPRVV